MDFPKEKIEFVTSHGGEVTDSGWLVLDVRTLDLEGVTQIYIDVRDVEAARARGDRQSEAVRKARELLGG